LLFTSTISLRVGATASRAETKNEFDKSKELILTRQHPPGQARYSAFDPRLYGQSWFLTFLPTLYCIASAPSSRGQTATNMTLKRDLETGLIVIQSFDSKRKKNYYHDPEKGEMRRSFEAFMEEERREEFMSRWDAHGPPTELINIPLVGPPLPLFHITPNDYLVSREPDASKHTHCLNDDNRSGLWVTIVGDRVKKLTDPKAPFLNRLAHLCSQAKIRDCKNEACGSRRKDIENAVPQCEWNPFREWAVVVISCQAAFTPQKRATRPFFHLSAAANICHWLLMEYKLEAKPLTRELLGSGDRRAKIDLLDVIEVIYWMLVVQASLGQGTVLGGSWGPDFLPKEITGPAARRASGRARKLGLCQNRLWNLALVSERKEADLLGIMETAEKYKQLKHHGHDDCNESFCLDTALNSTKVKQCHKCKDEDCPQVKFNPDRLNESLKNNGRTVWSLHTPRNEPFKVSQSQDYVAISHIWADGTGIGVRDPGKVNECLFNFLKKYIEELQCEAIWWDTISIPTEPMMRRKAINEMHHNYSRAKYTLLHDKYLVDFDWADDGSPCLALIFSPWLTRGWTALELIMSKKVKVLYKGPDGPVIKDLDEDILAQDPRYCTRAHWIASTIIRRLRKPIESITDLLAVLKPRNTSWPRDRMIIAGLLVGLDDFDYTKRPDEITKAIIERCYTMEQSSLFHGQATMADSGGWSWCPTSLYDLPSNSLGDMFEEGSVGDPTCVVDVNGVIAGHWHHRLLEQEDVTMNRLIPNTPHLSVKLRIQHALRQWRNCMLLRKDWWHTDLPGLLVITVDRDEDFIHCRYVGTVLECAPPFSGRHDWRYGYSAFKIGNDEGKPGAPARDFYDPIEDQSRWYYEESLRNPLRESRPVVETVWDYKWLHGKLWMGDQRFQGQLLVARHLASTGTTEAFPLQIVENPLTPHPYSLDLTRMVISMNPKVRLGEIPEFRADPESRKVTSGTNQSLTLKRVRLNSSSWPPRTVPANERTKSIADHNDLYRPEKFSDGLFRLEVGDITHTFSAINRQLFTPDDERPYKGVWTGI